MAQNPRERVTDSTCASSTSCASDISQAGNVGDWNSLHIPDCRERHQQWVKESSAFVSWVITLKQHTPLPQTQAWSRWITMKILKISLKITKIEFCYFFIQKSKHTNNTGNNRWSSPGQSFSHLIKGKLCHHLIQWKNSFRSPWEQHRVYNT